MTLIIDPSSNEEQVLSKIIRTKGKSVLEIGCGEGRISKYLSTNAHSYFGIDENQEKLVLARIKAKNAKFYSQHINNHNYPNSSFEIIIIRHKLHEINMSNQKEFMKKIYKWLAPGGLLFIIEATPKGEVQDLFSTAYELKLNEDHHARLSYSHKIIKAFIHSRYFHKVYEVKYNVAWMFKDAIDLFDTMSKKIPYLNKVENNHHYRSIILEDFGLKLRKKPLMLQNQLIVYGLQKTNRKPKKISLFLRRPKHITDHHIE